MHIRPAVAAVLALGAIATVVAIGCDLSPAWRYGLAGGVGALYLLTKVKHWL